MKIVWSGMAALLLWGGAAGAQQGPAKAKNALPHNSPDPRKCRKCWPAYEAALGYVRKNLGSATFQAQMVCAWLLLADNRYPSDVERCVKTALQWESRRGSSQHAQNWYPALAGLFLAEYYKYFPTPDVQKGLNEIIQHFVETQERTGGWFKWFEGAYKDRLDYAVKDLGMLDAIILGFLHTVKTQGFKVPETTLSKAEACMEGILSANGISYGTPSKWGETTGARGSFLMLGLDWAGLYQHKAWKTYEKLLPRLIPNLQKGHHVGGLHCLGVVLGCHLLGPQLYGQLTAKWLDHYLNEQDDQGGVYIGDDGDAGGEKGLFRGNIASTASFALMILLQDPKILRPPRRKPVPQPKTDEKPAPPAVPSKSGK